MLGNSTRGLIPLQKQHLYRCCALLIALYGFQLWYYNKAPLHYPFNILKKMQHRAAIWIIGAFCTSPIEGIEAIVGLISIHLHLKKLYDRFLLRRFLLFSNHIIKSFTTHDNSQSCYDQCLLDAAWTWAKDNDDIIGCTTSISVSASCSRCNILALAS